jgi:hypothetical protein
LSRQKQKTLFTLPNLQQKKKIIKFYTNKIGSSLTSVTFLLTLVEMNVLGAFPFCIIAFYRHLVGNWASVAIFLALNDETIEEF